MECITVYILLRSALLLGSRLDLAARLQVHSNFQPAQSASNKLLYDNKGQSDKVIIIYYYSCHFTVLVGKLQKQQIIYIINLELELPSTKFKFKFKFKLHALSEKSNREQDPSNASHEGH